MTETDKEIREMLESIGFRKLKKVCVPDKNASVDEDFDGDDDYETHMKFETRMSNFV